MKHRTNVQATIEHPETEERVIVNVIVDHWYYPQTYEQPEESDFEIISHDAPEWVTDEMLDKAIENGEYYTPEADHNNGL
jgi:hypothetical protein